MRSKAIFAALGVFVPATAFASQPYPGIDHEKSAGQDGGGPYQTVAIDLTKWRIRQSNPGSYGQYAADYAKSTGAVVVINSNFCASATGPSCGLEVGFGVTAQTSYLDSDTNNCRDSIGFRYGDGLVDAFDSWSLAKGPPPNALTDVATGMPFMLRSGVKNTTPIPKFAETQAPRTVLGVSKDGKTAYLIVTQGRDVPAGAAGYRTDGVLVDIVASLGAWDAINLDGGGSSLLWIGAEGGIQNEPTDGQERQVCAHLGVVPAPPPEPTDAGTDASEPPPSEDAAPPPASDASADASQAPPAPEIDANGCSCRAAGESRSEAFGVLAIGALVAFARRRSTADRSRP